MRKFVKHCLIPHRDNEYTPHLFHIKGAALVGLFCLSLFSLSLSYPTLLRKFDFLSAVISSVMIDLTNENRALYSLTPLARSPLLEAAAKEKANDMAKGGYFAHVSPSGVTPWFWFAKNGYKFIYAGENLAVNFTESGAVTQAWMNSPTHRANILNQQFTEIGIATAEGTYEGRPAIFVAQYFGRPIIEKAVALPTASAPTISSLPPRVPVVKSVPLARGNTEMAAKNAEVKEPTPPPLAREVTTLGSTQYASLSEKVAGSPNSVLRAIYFAILAIIAGAMVLSLLIEFRRHRGRHLTSGAVLAGIILLLILSYQYLNALPVSIV